MDSRIEKLKTDKECKVFAKNARRLGRPDLAFEAERRAIQILAQNHDVTGAVEQEAVQAIYAYEHILSEKNGRRTRATRTWQMVERHGIIEAISRVVARRTDAAGFLLLKERGMEDLSFEAVVLRHPAHFSLECVQSAKDRLTEYQSRTPNS